MSDKLKQYVGEQNAALSTLAGEMASIGRRVHRLQSDLKEANVLRAQLESQLEAAKQEAASKESRPGAADSGVSEALLERVASIVASAEEPGGGSSDDDGELRAEEVPERLQALLAHHADRAAVAEQAMATMRSHHAAQAERISELSRLQEQQLADLRQQEARHQELLAQSSKQADAAAASDAAALEQLERELEQRREVVQAEVARLEARRVQLVAACEELAQQSTGMSKAMAEEQHVEVLRTHIVALTGVVRTLSRSDGDAVVSGGRGLVRAVCVCEWRG